MAAPFKSPQSLGFSGLALSGALAATLLISACSGSATPEQSTQRQAPTIPVTAAHVERGTIEQSLAYSGDIRASGQVTVFAKGTGRVERVLVDVESVVWRLLHTSQCDDFRENAREQALHKEHLNAAHRVQVESRTGFVVPVMDQAQYAPPLFVLAEPARVSAHRGFHAAHVAAELVGLGHRGDELPRLVPRWCRAQRS